MIVFLYVIIILLLCFLLSNITLEIKNIEIHDITEFKNIIKSLMLKDYNMALDNFSIKVRVLFNFLHIIPICIYVIDRKGFKKLLKRVKTKNANSINKNNIIKNNLDFEIKMLKVNISLGMNNAAITAIISSIIIGTLNIVYSNIVSLDEEKSKKRSYYQQRNFTFDVMPVYTNDFSFSLSIVSKIDFEILKIVREYVMYKIYNLVNNTNEVKKIEEEN